MEAHLDHYKQPGTTTILLNLVPAVHRVPRRRPVRPGEMSSPKKRPVPFRTGPGPFNRPDRSAPNSSLRLRHSGLPPISCSSALPHAKLLRLGTAGRPWRTNVDAASASSKILDMGWVPQTSMPVQASPAAPLVHPPTASNRQHSPQSGLVSLGLISSTRCCVARLPAARCTMSSARPATPTGKVRNTQNSLLRAGARLQLLGVAGQRIHTRGQTQQQQKQNRVAYMLQGRGEVPPHLGFRQNRLPTLP